MKISKNINEVVKSLWLGINKSDLSYLRWKEASSVISNEKSSPLYQKGYAAAEESVENKLCKEINKAEEEGYCLGHKEGYSAAIEEISEAVKAKKK